MIDHFCFVVYQPCSISSGNESWLYTAWLFMIMLLLKIIITPDAFLEHLSVHHIDGFGDLARFCRSFWSWNGACRFIHGITEHREHVY